MKRFLWLALLTALTIFFAAPVALAILDVWCYAVLGHAVTGIEWNADSVPIALAFLIPAAACAIFAAIVAEEPASSADAAWRYVPPPPPPKRPGTNPPPTYERPPTPPSPPPRRDARG